jgi:hypothetical protein
MKNNSGLNKRKISLFGDITIDLVLDKTDGIY